VTESAFQDDSISAPSKRLTLMPNAAHERIKEEAMKSIGSDELKRREVGGTYKGPRNDPEAKWAYQAAGRIRREGERSGLAGGKSGENGGGSVRRWLVLHCNRDRKFRNCCIQPLIMSSRHSNYVIHISVT
jgi:hypothetical protein